VLLAAGTVGTVVLWPAQAATRLPPGQRQLGGSGPAGLGTGAARANLATTQGGSQVLATRAGLYLATRAQKAPAPAAPARPAAPAAPSGTPQQIAESMLGSFGWSQGEFSCLDLLWNAESGWNVYASNPVSGAYGIPQALPGARMGSAGPDWQSDAATQIRWGLEYIQSDYGSPCGAWAHEQSDGWY
jgi:hypothetical protein